MSTYPLSELFHRWKLGELTAEQAVGFMMQHLLDFEERLIALEKGRPPQAPPPVQATRPRFRKAK